jgi:hypothetical protein
MLAGIAVLVTSLLVGGWLAVVLGAARYEMRRLANANPPRVTGEILVESNVPTPIDQATPASQSLPADDEPDVELDATLPVDESARTYELPPRPILIAGLRDAALHRLILR